MAYKLRNTAFTTKAQHFNNQKGQFQRFAFASLVLLVSNPLGITLTNYKKAGVNLPFLTVVILQLIHKTSC